MGKHEQASLFRWARRNLKAYYMSCYEIFLIYLCDMELLSDVTKYFLTSHRIFCHVTSIVCFDISNGLLILNMDLAKKPIESNVMWTFENKKNLKDTFYHPSCNQCSKCLMLLNNNYNIFKNVEMGGNCILEKYLMKIKFSKYMTNMCWNGQGIIHKYTSFYNDWKGTKWRKKTLGFTKI
jgi:hypothetical protein